MKRLPLGETGEKDVKAGPGKEALPCLLGALSRRPGQVRPFSRIGKYIHNNRWFRVQPHLSGMVFNLTVEV